MMGEFLEEFYMSPVILGHTSCLEMLEVISFATTANKNRLIMKTVE